MIREHVHTTADGYYSCMIRMQRAQPRKCISQQPLSKRISCFRAAAAIIMQRFFRNLMT